MTVDILSVYGPAGKLIPRQAPPVPGVSCPIWCESPHDEGDDADYHHGAYTTIPMYKVVTIADGKTYTDRNGECRVGLEQSEDERHPRVIFDGGLATWMTAGEADNLATILRDFVADMGRETSGPEPCWCHQEHDPRDEHESEVKTVYLTTYGEFAPRELLVSICAPLHRRTYIEITNASHGNTATHLLPSEAGRVADALVLLSLAVRLCEGSTR
jgi:hypothetical protein